MLTRLQSRGNATFICPGKANEEFDLLYCDTHFADAVWNETCDESQAAQHRPCLDENSTKPPLKLDSHFPNKFTYLLIHLPNKLNGADFEIEQDI